MAGRERNSILVAQGQELGSWNTDNQGQGESWCCVEELATRLAFW
jgi:hypothetical protein